RAGFVLAIVALGPLVRSANAQLCNTSGAAAACTITATTSVTVPVLLRMTIGSATTAFGTIAAADYNLGSKSLAGPTITTKANQGWRVQISSTATFWTAVTTDPGNPARATKPLADLQWSTALAGTYNSVTGTGATVGSSSSGTSGTVSPIFFQSLWSYAVDTPGNYSIGVTFTLLSP
ncbi:MAG TPA: hypothetical protein VF454_01485, partial [Gemmatimonadales bacterium]